MRRKDSARWQIRRFLRLFLPPACVLAAAVLGVFVYLTYRLTHPAAVQEPVNPSHFLLPSKDVDWNSMDGVRIPGWWIAGSNGAPGVVLAPGYGMSRADVLSLAAALYLEGYNVLTYDSRGSGAVPRGASSLGLEETDDMMAALNFLKSRREVDTKCLGIWGVDVNARAALKIAASEKDVRAVVADSVYDSAADFLGVLIREDLGWDSRVLEFGCRQMFRLSRIGAKAAVDERLPHGELGRRSILFIRGDNRADVARLTAALYEVVQPPRELITMRSARARLMGSEELNSYDRQVTNFFREHLH